MATDLSGLINFKNKLERYKSINSKFANEVLDAVLTRAEQIARQEYAGFAVEIGREMTSAGVGRLYAKGDGIAYIEFGTGLVGEQSGYPKDKLPKEKLQFESPKGSPQQTDGWEYYYDNPETKIMGGWFFGKTFTQGKKAGMQMYRTSQQLKREIATIVKNKIEGVMANV
jgi:hypothetical protein